MACGLHAGRARTVAPRSCQLLGLVLDPGLGAHVLLLDLVARAPLADVDAAYRRFVDLYDTATIHPSTS